MFHRHYVPQLRNGLWFTPTRLVFCHRELFYWLYNDDAVRYAASSSSLALYGSIPVMHAKFPDATVRLFYPVAPETWIGKLSINCAMPRQAADEYRFRP